VSKREQKAKKNKTSKNEQKRKINMYIRSAGNRGKGSGQSERKINNTTKKRRTENQYSAIIL
jgi:hypothetical protein